MYFSMCPPNHVNHHFRAADTINQLADRKYSIVKHKVIPIRVLLGQAQKVVGSATINLRPGHAAALPYMSTIIIM
ncbi:MAG: hypothetical protein WCG34_07440 [Leptolinea sp.]